jgi:hypothetical protein
LLTPWMMFEAQVGVKAGRPTHGGPAVTIAAPASGETSEGQLEEDEFHILWLVHRNRPSAILLSAALKTGGASSMRHPRSRRCWTGTGLEAGRFSDGVTITNSDLVGGRSGTA